MNSPPSSPSPSLADHVWWRWALVLGTAGAVLAFEPPNDVTTQSWRLLAIFLATIVGSIVRPTASGAVVFFGICAIAVTGTMSPVDALRGYADPLVWLVLCAFMISRGVMVTGLGRRIAFVFIRFLGRRSIGLAYALVATDVVLASLVPSNSARAGGIVFPVTRSVAEAYNSAPGDSRRRLGAFLMTAVYQGDVVACAMFLTGQASNVMIARFAFEAAGVQVGYAFWFIGAFLPGILSILLVVYAIYRLYPPEVTHTPEATALARDELSRMGPMSRSERLMMAVFALTAGLWMTTRFHHLDYTVVALLGVSTLIITRVLAWEDVLSDRAQWDTFLWYGGLVRMAQALGETGITRRFAEVAASMTTGWSWPAALLVLLLVYFYAHYGFASITAHVTAMFHRFLVVVIGTGAPATLAVLILAYTSNLSASLTHYGTTTAPIYFGARYVTQREWWRVGFSASVITLSIFGTVGLFWWRILGYW